MKDDIKNLELRIEELENQLKGIGSQMAEIDPEKMKIFKEVSLQLGFDPDSVCGINECRVCVVCKPCQVCQVCEVCQVCKPCEVCQVCKPCEVCQVCKPCEVCQVCKPCEVCQVCKPCTVCKPCVVCINECSCGPCIQGNFNVGSGRFGNLG